MLKNVKIGGIMKKLLFGILLIVVGCAGTQDLAPDGTPIPIGVNTIIFQIQESPEDAFRDIGRHLIQNGFSIENSSDQFLTLTTSYRNTSSGSLSAATDISITASVMDDHILLYGTARQGMQLGTTDLGENRIEHRGQSGSIMRNAWDELYQLALSFSENLRFETR